VLAIVGEQHKPEHRHDQRAPDAFGIERPMVEQNIYDYRPNVQGRRNIAIDQQRRAAKLAVDCRVLGG